MSGVRRRLQIFILLFFFSTAFGTIGFMSIEGLGLIEAFYYNIVTMSTVGYGDITPKTDAGRLFSILIIVMGGASFLGVIANTTELMLARRDKRIRQKKVNMILGIFFSEVGNRLLGFFSQLDPAAHLLGNELRFDGSWQDEKFVLAAERVGKHPCDINMTEEMLPDLRAFFKDRRSVLVDLLENPMLVLEEKLTDTLLAIFHLADELACRPSLHHLPKADLSHLAGDIRRAYSRLVGEWILYLRHLRENYPFLFSLAIRTNPFNPDASPVIGE